MTFRGHDLWGACFVIVVYLCGGLVFHFLLCLSFHPILPFLLVFGSGLLTLRSHLTLFVVVVANGFKTFHFSDSTIFYC